MAVLALLDERSLRRLGIAAVWLATFAWAWGYVLIKWSSPRWAPSRDVQAPGGRRHLVLCHGPDRLARLLAGVPRVRAHAASASASIRSRTSAA
jgi:hypothetical protein